MTTSKRNKTKGSEVKFKEPESAPNYTDNAATESHPVDFPVVGIGASAGGLAAFEAPMRGICQGANDLSFDFFRLFDVWTPIRTP